MPPPLISIQMPAFNAERYIARSIESALCQTYPHWELVVVNDGSMDQTAEIIAGFHDPRIRVFYQPNGGEAAARNTALQNTRGEYLTFLDADDLYLPDHLERIVQFFQDHPETGGVYTNGAYINQDGERLKLLSDRRRGPFTGDIFAEVIRSSDVFGAPLCVALKTQVIREHSLTFDTRITIGPDWDFLAEYAEVATFEYIDAVTCLYRVHPSQISTRTGSSKRTQSLALCREKSIHRKRFGDCSVAVRVAVFYDLLINLLRGQPERQAAVMRWPEFQALPANERSRLSRRAAVEALQRGEPAALPLAWLRYAYQQNPKDTRALLLHLACSVHPRLCGYLLRVKQEPQPDPSGVSPFADLQKR